MIFSLFNYLPLMKVLSGSLKSISFLLKITLITFEIFQKSNFLEYFSYCKVITTMVFKLKQNGIFVELLNLVSGIPRNRRQRVVARQPNLKY